MASVDDHYAAAQAHNANAPGLLVSVQDGRTGLDLTYVTGFADLATGEKLTAEHSFKIASVTKTMVTTVICQLIDEGRLSFETSVAEFFPALPDAKNVTIEMLGNMTSGYFDYLNDDETLHSFDNIPHFTATPDELVAVGMSHGPVYPPGTGFNYSNTNTVILGQIIEQVTGNSLETELRNRLFIPLGMEKSGAPASGSYLPEPRAHSYHPDTHEDWTDQMDYAPEYACGNAYATVHDLKIWVQALAEGSLVKAATQKRRLSGGKAFPGTSFVYHFGIINYHGFLGHSGNTDYYLTEAFYNPQLDISIIVLCNTSTAGFTGMVFEDLVKLLIPAAKG